MKTICYEQDIVAWANEQAHLLRSGRFDQLDLAHLAEEIEDVGKSEHRELANRMAVLLSQLLKWKYQPERRGNSWRNTVQVQRKAIAVRLKNIPSLQPMLSDTGWQEVMWADAGALFTGETGIDNLPERDPWTAAEILDQEWLPD